VLDQEGRHDAGAIKTLAVGLERDRLTVAGRLSTWLTAYAIPAWSIPPDTVPEIASIDIGSPSLHHCTNYEWVLGRYQNGFRPCPKLTLIRLREDCFNKTVGSLKCRFSCS
jgi:hypothetical protein